MTKKLLALTLIMTLLCVCGANAELKVTNQTVIPVDEGEFGFSIFVYTELFNDGDEAVVLDYGHLYARDENGTEMEEHPFYYTWPMIIRPGCTAYTNTVDYMDDVLNEDAVWETALEYHAVEAAPELMLTVTEAQLLPCYDADDMLTYNVYVTFRNDYSDTFYNPTVCVAVFDSDGKIAFCFAWSFDNLGLPAGQYAEALIPVPTLISDYWNATVIPENVQAFAFYDEWDR